MLSSSFKAVLGVIVEEEDTDEDPPTNIKRLRIYILTSMATYMAQKSPPLPLKVQHCFITEISQPLQFHHCLPLLLTQWN